MGGGKFSSADWVVKVDADAVFIPSRLSKKLESQLVPPSGIYLENCKYVEYGYFGNLEVFSNAAFATLIANIDDCKADSQINWKVGVKNGLARPIGQLTSRKTKSGNPRVHGQPRQPCTHSRK